MSESFPGASQNASPLPLVPESPGGSHPVQTERWEREWALGFLNVSPFFQIQGSRGAWQSNHAQLWAWPGVQHRAKFPTAGKPVKSRAQNCWGLRGPNDGGCSRKKIRTGTEWALLSSAWMGLSGSSPSWGCGGWREGQGTAAVGGCEGQRGTGAGQPPWSVTVLEFYNHPLPAQQWPAGGEGCPTAMQSRQALGD